MMKRMSYDCPSTVGHCAHTRFEKIQSPADYLKRSYGEKHKRKQNCTHYSKKEKNREHSQENVCSGRENCSEEPERPLPSTTPFHCTYFSLPFLYNPSPSPSTLTAWVVDTSHFRPALCPRGTK